MEKELGVPVADVDSAEYWIEREDPARLEDYVRKIMEQAARPRAIVLVSEHPLVRESLFLSGVEYVRVDPHKEDMNVMFEREVSPLSCVESLFTDEESPFSERSPCRMLTPCRGVCEENKIPPKMDSGAID